MANIDKELNQIKHAVYGREVRGSIHDGIDKINKESEGSRQIANNTEQRQDAVEQQFNTLLGEWSDDRPIDNAETIAARTNTKESKTYENLGKRLDEEYGKVTAQLAEADKQRLSESVISRKQIVKDKPTLLISWTDDDGFLEVYDIFKPIMKEYNIPITSGLITSKIGTDDSKYLNESQIKELAELGMEFMSHSHLHDPNHRLTDMTEEEVDYDLRTSQQIIKQMGYNHRGLILPFVDNNEIIQRVARRYYDYVIGSGANLGQGKPFYPGHYSNYYIRRVRTENGFDFVKQRIDEAKASGRAWVVLDSHIYYEVYTPSYVRQIIDYALSQGFEFITTEDGMNTFGNVAQFGDPLKGGYDKLDYYDAGTRIAADGSIHGAKLGNVVRFGDREVSDNTLPSFFPDNTVSITKIRSLESEGFPNNKPGRLETVKFDEDTYVYQNYYTSDVTRKYTRYWDTLNDQWSNWSIVELGEYLGLNAFKPNDPPHTNRFRPKVAYTVINNVGKDGFPENKPGTLITYDLTYDDFPFQLYYIRHDRKTYRRDWYGSDWSPWFLVQNTVGATHRAVNSRTSVNLPVDYDVGITMLYISPSANDTGLPEGLSSGNLVTYKEDGGIGRSYQEFRGTASSSKYFRHEKEDGTWATWKKYVMEDV